MTDVVVATEVYVPKQPDRGLSSQDKVLGRLHSGWSRVHDGLILARLWELLPGKRVRITVEIVGGEMTDSLGNLLRGQEVRSKEPDSALGERHRLAVAHAESARTQLDLLLRQLWVRSADTEMLEAARTDLEDALVHLREGYES